MITCRNTFHIFWTYCMQLGNMPTFNIKGMRQEGQVWSTHFVYLACQVWSTARKSLYGLLNVKTSMNLLTPLKVSDLNLLFLFFSYFWNIKTSPQITEITFGILVTSTLFKNFRRQWALLEFNSSNNMSEKLCLESRRFYDRLYSQTG